MRNYTEKTYRSRVNAGAQMLDEHLPGWWKAGKINLRALNVESCVHCVLGQLFGSYADGLLWMKEKTGGKYATAHGFATGGPMKDYELITRLWKVQIEERRLEAARAEAKEKEYVLVA